MTDTPKPAPKGGIAGIAIGAVGVVLALVAAVVAINQVAAAKKLDRSLAEARKDLAMQGKDLEEAGLAARTALERIDSLKNDHATQLAAAREALEKARSEVTEELEAKDREIAALQKKVNDLENKPAPASAAKKPISLFNGKDLTGWVGIGGELTNWGVEDGLLVCKGGKGAKWISTTEQYSDFDLTLDFRLPKGGNSGVFIRTDRQGNPAHKAMEIQVIDDLGYEAAHNYKLKDHQNTGSIYAVVAPSKAMAKDAGQWSQMRIRCEGGLVQVWHNGEQIVNADMDGYDQLRKRPRSGYIGLQNHGSKMAYRNLILKPLN